MAQLLFSQPQNPWFILVLFFEGLWDICFQIFSPFLLVFLHIFFLTYCSLFWKITKWEEVLFKAIMGFRSLNWFVDFIFLEILSLTASSTGIGKFTWRIDGILYFHVWARSNFLSSLTLMIIDFALMVLGQMDSWWVRYEGTNIRIVFCWASILTSFQFFSEIFYSICVSSLNWWIFTWFISFKV